jgi:transcriptional regulator with XRE-family HTH domain
VTLKSLRQQARLSQVKAARAADVDPQTVARLERGQNRNPELKVLQGLARAYNVSLTRIIQALNQSIKERDEVAA